MAAMTEGMMIAVMSAVRTAEIIAKMIDVKTQRHRSRLTRKPIDPGHGLAHLLRVPLQRKPAEADHGHPQHLQLRGTCFINLFERKKADETVGHLAQIVSRVVRMTATQSQAVHDETLQMHPLNTTLDDQLYFQSRSLMVLSTKFMTTRLRLKDRLMLHLHFRFVGSKPSPDLWGSRII